MDQDEFNSSDIEFEPAPNEFDYAGARSIEDMLAHAVVDRLESKKASKQLLFVKCSKKTTYSNHLWYVRRQQYQFELFQYLLNRFGLPSPDSASSLSTTPPTISRLITSEVQQIHRISYRDSQS